MRGVPFQDYDMTLCCWKSFIVKYGRKNNGDEINNFSSALWPQERRNHAYRRVSVVVRMCQLQNDIKTKARRLLCVLQATGWQSVRLCSEEQVDADHTLLTTQGKSVSVIHS